MPVRAIDGYVDPTPTPDKQRNLNWGYRATALTPSFINENPVHAAQLITSNVPLKHLTTIGENWNAMSDWVGQQTVFGGVHGALASAYLKVLSNPDPSQRASGLMTLQAIGQLTPGEQQVFTSWLQHPDAVAPNQAGQLQEAVSGVVGGTA